MKHLDKVRANDFDRRVGVIQTEYAIKLGVGNSVLDVGCGVGQYTPMFLKRFKTVVGLDPDEEFLKEAVKNTDKRIIYIKGYGETFKTDMKFDTISMNNILEHVDDPTLLLRNCKKYLKRGGRIIAQVPNSHSITRRLGVIMGMIDSLENISEKEKDFYGHQRVYNLNTLVGDCWFAGLTVFGTGGILYKPLPNVMLESLCKKQGKKWAKKFVNALVKFGEDRPDECACIYVVCG